MDIEIGRNIPLAGMLRSLLCRRAFDRVSEEAGAVLIKQFSLNGNVGDYVGWGTMCAASKGGIMVMNTKYSA